MIRLLNNSIAASAAETDPTNITDNARIEIGLMAHVVGFGTYKLLAGKFLAMIVSSASDSGFDLEI